MTIETILPPNATALERALEDAGATRIDGIDAPVDSLWNPQTCPAPLLAWLAWGLSIDRWNPAWSEVQKRTAIAEAIQRQRMKGTPAQLRDILADYEPLLQLVEWFAMAPRGAPHTFEIRLPRGDARTPAARTAMILDVLRDIALVKPVRSHFRFVQLLDALNPIRAVAALNFASFIRLDGVAVEAADLPWDSFLQTDEGEPLQTESGEFVEA